MDRGSPDLEILPMSRAELDEWAALEGWNPGLGDATTSTPPIPTVF
jgi:hypothetical protein